MTPTGTNRLGLVEHLSFVEFGYFGAVVGRPVEDARAPGSRTRGSRTGTPGRWPRSRARPSSTVTAAAWAHTNATIEQLPQDASGHVTWWRPGRRDVTLHRILAHVVVRELIDGAVGLRPGSDNLPEADEAWWRAYCERLEAEARTAPDR